MIENDNCRDDQDCNDEARAEDTMNKNVYMANTPQPSTSEQPCQDGQCGTKPEAANEGVSEAQASDEPKAA